MTDTASNSVSEIPNVDPGTRFKEAKGTTSPPAVQNTSDEASSTRGFLANAERKSVTIRIIPQKADNNVSRDSTS